MKGGGVAMYLEDDMNYTLMDDPGVFLGEFDSVSLELTVNCSKCDHLSCSHHK